MPVQAYSDGALLWATIFGLLFGVTHLVTTSGIAWLSAATASWEPLAYVFLAIAIFLFFYGWKGWVRFSLFLALIGTLLYWIVATGGLA